MDYLPGRDLREFLFECAHLPGPQRIARIVAVLSQVAHAVAHAHAHGIAHRDIKPSNIRVAADTDAAVLLDFGISKCLDDVGLTGVEMPGTALYMAPEQLDVRLHASDHLIDIWALGVTLYVALTGELPFKGDTPLALSHDVVFAEPDPPSCINGRISRDLEEIVLGCMRKDARERIQSAAEVARLLERAHAAATSSTTIGRDGRTWSPAAPAAAYRRRPSRYARPSAPSWPSRTCTAEPPTALEPPPDGSGGTAATPATPRRRRALVARIVLSAACLAALTLARGMGVVEASRAQDEPAFRQDETIAPATTASLVADPRVAAMLADDDEVARSVLLYTADIDVQSRRNLMSALHALSADRAAEALPRLRSFARDNQKCSLITLARFWIATALLATGAPGDAIASYDEIVADAPKSRFAPRALLLQAAAQRALGDAGKSALLLQRLGSEYPTSQAARDARLSNEETRLLAPSG